MSEERSLIDIVESVPSTSTAPLSTSGSEDFESKGFVSVSLNSTENIDEIIEDENSKTEEREQYEEQFLADEEGESEEDEQSGEEDELSPEDSQEETETGRFGRIWGFVKDTATSMWEWGDWIGEKIAWTIGVTSSRYHDQIIQAEKLRQIASEKVDVETGRRFGVGRTHPDFNQFPDGDLMNFLYKQGISNTQKQILDINKPKREQIVQFLPEEGSELEIATRPSIVKLPTELGVIEEDLLPLELNKDEDEDSDDF